jgi:hypothetical protein
MQRKNVRLEYSMTGLEGRLDNAIRAWNVALILGDLREHEKTEEKLLEALEEYEIALSKGHPQALKSPDDSKLLSWAAGSGNETVVRLQLETLKIETDSKDEKSRGLL